MHNEEPHVVDDWLFHVSPSVNRDRIFSEGLRTDARPNRGLLGAPEARGGIYVCVDLDEARWIADHLSPKRIRVDIWRFRTESATLVSSDHGFLMSVSSIPREHIELVETRQRSPFQIRGRLERVVNALAVTLERLSGGLKSR